MGEGGVGARCGKGKGSLRDIDMVLVFVKGLLIGCRRTGNRTDEEWSGYERFKNPCFTEKMEN